MNWQRNSKSYNVNEAFVLDDTFPKGKQEETIRERSDSQSSVEDDDDHVANPRGLPTQAESIDFGLDDDVNKGKPFRDCLMGCFVIFVVLAMTTCVAILLYFILINTVFVESDTKTTVSGYTGALTIEGTVLLNETYDSDLADPESMTYRDMENEFLSSMSGSFSNSTLADIYNGTNVERFEQGSIRIVFSLFLLSAPNDADTETEVILEVQVTIGDGIYSGFFDVFDVIEDSLEITTVNQQSETTAEPPIAATEAPVEPSTVSTINSVTSQLMISLSTLLSTPVTTTETVAPTIPTTTRLFSTHAPTSPNIDLSTFSTTATQSTTTSPSTTKPTTIPSASTYSQTVGTTDSTTTSSTVINLSTTSSTTIDNSTGTVQLTTKPTTISPSATYSQTVGTTFSTTTSSTVVNVSTATSSTTIDNSTGTFNFTNKLTTIPLSSTSDTTFTTIPSTTRISTIATTTSPASPPTIPTTIDNVSTTDSVTSKTTPNITSPSSSSSPTSSTVIDNSTRTGLLTTKPTTISPSATYSQTVGTTFSATTSSNTVNVSTTSSTTTTPSPTIPTTIDTVSTTTNISLTKLTTIRQPSTDSPTSSAARVNITRQPKIHPALPDTCGARPAVNGSDSDGTARIVGGIQSGPGKWPWMGSLRDGTSHQCGAVLIHQEWAITAHHCIGFFDNIVLGDNDNSNSDPSPYRVQRNVQPFSNPDFDTVTDNGDIALLFLTEPVEFNDHVQPLCINTLKTEMTSFNNCFVTGWGTDDFFDQRAMRYLLEASIQMINRSVCSEWYQTFHVITNQHICAGEEDGRRDACSGDSGGPLQCQDGQGIWYLLGVVSFGQNCGNPRLPGVYTRVSTQIDFLSGILDTNIK
ncbi:mucin-5AC-like [Strongylocentrotus purpuratus]|uniref:Peptidase S1 domain-containing protein n=1 Tax=Strongylocentrotus purpuratus TaxID=7668 RepID=A0A7M7NZ21_STRPU|nr:mucin-5AC-like [Strongylocentrotus purpuratus]